MRILVVSNHFYPESFRINELAFALVERGHEVDVVTGIPNYPQGRFTKGYGLLRRRREVVRGVHVHRMPLIPRGQGRGWELALNYASAALMSTLIAPLECRDDYDVIFVYETSPITVALSAALLRRLRGVPLVMWVTDLWPESLTAAGAIESKAVLGSVRALVHFIYSQCDQILVSSPGMVDHVHRTGGYSGEAEHFPYWVEDQTDGTDVAISGPMPVGADDTFRVLFAGNVGVAQSFATILDAAEKVRKLQSEAGGRAVEWWVAGDGRALPWVREQIARRELRDQVKLLGRLPTRDMPGLFRQADALLVTLKREPIFAVTVPSKLQAYLAAGKPILAALDGDGADLVIQADAGLAVPAEDSTGLALAAMRLAAMETSQLHMMGERGRAYCDRHFRADQAFARLEAILGAAARGEKGGRPGADVGSELNAVGARSDR